MKRIRSQSWVGDINGLDMSVEILETGEIYPVLRVEGSDTDGYTYVVLVDEAEGLFRVEQRYSEDEVKVYGKRIRLNKVSRLARVGMSAYIGEEGLDETWQASFDATTECVFCGADARIAFVGYEKSLQKGGEEKYIYEMHPNIPDNMWVYDACSVALYLCTQCLEPTAVMNQA